MPLVSQGEIAAFEQRLGEAVVAGDVSEFDVIGYGEVTIAEEWKRVIGRPGSWEMG